MAKIHPTAIVEDGAQLGADVEIGPMAHIGPDVRLGDGVRVAQGAIVDGHTTIGAMCQIFPYACIGMKTQDLKYKDGSVSYVEIGERTVIREFATVHLGTADGEKTVIGSDCLFMCYCHAAHGVILGRLSPSHSTQNTPFFNIFLTAKFIPLGISETNFAILQD